VPSELDKYATDKQLQQIDDFKFCIARFAFCFVFDKICWFVTQNYKLVMLFTIFLSKTNILEETLNEEDRR